MTIVNTGSFPLQVPESGSVNFVNELVEQMRRMILQLVLRTLEESLETGVDRIQRQSGRAIDPRKELAPANARFFAPRILSSLPFRMMTFPQRLWA